MSERTYCTYLPTFEYQTWEISAEAVGGQFGGGHEGQRWANLGFEGFIVCIHNEGINNHLFIIIITTNYCNNLLFIHDFFITTKSFI